ncbi:MAG: S41 family peptidase [Pedobacter sp.]|nr:S41 family peptidase [Pedobacter sp.]MDQ8052952.1 S41 family peptidase [Pedobacter sp.]
MKRNLLFILLILGIGAKAQDQNRKDLEFLVKTIQKLPSYQDQVKDNPKLRYDINQIPFSDNETTFELFLKFYSLIAPIRDNHLTFYTNRDSAFAKPALLHLEKSLIDSALQKSGDDSICGTYYAAAYQIQIIKLGEKYFGIAQHNKQFETRFVLLKTIPNHFDMIGFVKDGGGYFLYRNVSFASGRLVGTPYRKYRGADFFSLPSGTPKYEFKLLEDGIAYLRLGSFYASPEIIAESDQFFKQVVLPKNTKHLIVDLRDNRGGAFKNSKKFLDFVRGFDGKVHLMTNAYTGSNAEQFTIELMDQKNLVRYGETTAGVICYGNNVDTIIDLPSKRFSFYITDLKPKSKYIPFESYGVEPQIWLNGFTKDWVSQVMDYIKQN